MRPYLGSSIGLCALLAIAACGDDLPSGSGDGSSSGATETGQATGTTDVATPTPADSSTSAAATGTESGGTDSSSSSGTVEPIEVDVEVYTYASQPMVVDLAFSEPDLEATLEHPTDPGVRFGPVAGEEGETWVRVRGLAPETMHELDWSVEAPSGATDEGQTAFETLAPLPGYIPSFDIEGSGEGFGGFVLFDLLALTPDAPASLFMIDTEGQTRWHTGRQDGIIGPATVFAGAKLLDDGSLMFLRNFTLFVIDELGTEQLALTSEAMGLLGLHHDVIELPNGNFLALSFIFRDVDYPDIGLTHVAGDLIVEIDRTGSIVWEWDSFDHLDPLRRREGFDVLIFDVETGENGQDWTHGNGVIYDEASDTVLFSARHQDWLVQIDRGSGDVQWRLGPEGDFGLEGGGEFFYHQHSPQWQDDGSLLLYDNGVGNPNLADELETSRAIRYDLNTTTMMATQVWEDAAEDFVAPIAGDADRLPDGSILVTDSSIDMNIGQIYARVREIDEETSDTPQWSFTTDIGTFIYRCVPSLRLAGEVD
ncbi:MAG: aryl-sulfate sulfotransferase [Myxococcota bacterium]